MPARPRAALAAIGLALASATACTPTGNCPTSQGAVALASCVAAYEIDGRRYVEIPLPRALPARLVRTSGAVDGLVPPCNDVGGEVRCASSRVVPEAQPMSARRIRGIPADEALIRSGGAFAGETLLVPGDQNYAGIVSESVQALLDTLDRRRSRGHDGHATGRTLHLQDVLPDQLAVLSGQQWGMPASVPEDDSPLPSLLDDLPGRAVLAVAPDLTVLNGPVSHWSDLRILFSGADGRWRRLDLGDLALPASATYTDTYGAGALSPDGHWWAGPTRAGAVLLDLRSGESRLVSLDGSPGTLRWDDGRRAVLTSRRATDRIVLDGRPEAAGSSPHPVLRNHLRAPRSVGAVVTDADTGRRIGTLTHPRDQLVRDDVWLDDETLLVATTPYFLAWRPATGRLYRLTDARSLGDYWQVSAVPR